jgi:hypothetical protein
MAYQVAVGHDNEAGFVTTDPEPVCPLGIQYPVHVTAASGVTYADGAPFTVWEYDILTAAQYATKLTENGLTTAPDSVSANVTISTIAHDRSTYANYNAIVLHRKGEDAEFRDGLFRGVRFLYRQLEST